MLLSTFGMDFMNFVLGSYLVKPFTLRVYLTFNYFLSRIEEERSRRVSEILIVLVVDHLISYAI